MAEKNQRRGLGRGLSALMADIDAEAPRRGLDDSSEDTTARRPEVMIPIELIQPNPDQPRRSFESESLEELAHSIAHRGIIQPLILRAHPSKAGEYQIVAGERRWRAAQMAKLHEVPAILRQFDDTEVLEVAIIENIQRADLNPVDEAAGYRQLMDRFGHTQEKMAEALGKSRSHIANSLRLLSLPEEIREWLGAGRISAGHARALITANNPVALAREVIAKGLSVRETEKLAKKPEKQSAKPGRAGQAEKDADTRALEQDLSSALGLKVTVDHVENSGRGRVTIGYSNLEELDELCRLLSGSGD